MGFRGELRSWMGPRGFAALSVAQGAKLVVYAVLADDQGENSIAGGIADALSSSGSISSS